MIKPDKSKQDSKKIQVKDMFNDISSRYDQINKMMTLNMDKNWRKIVYHLSMQDNPSKIIDIATGTGDIALCFANDNVEVIGVDNASMMLDIANTKVSETTNVKFKLEDAENMSFEDNTFDVATVGFGVRNFEDLNQGLREIKRVLKPGKKLIILETAVPSFFLFRFGYFLYTKFVVPILGRIIAKNQQAYQYLSTSAEHFPHGKEFQLILEKAGFENIKVKYLSLGIVNIYQASKPI
jgi:demethylmenaquinone methyltransferase/2-methoxy-6-polyprenyl-1,4-benzoquinol methylase